MKQEYLLAAGVFIIFVAFAMLNLPTTEKLQTGVVVRDDGILGFNANVDALHFGSVPKGNIGERKIILKNDNDFSKIVKLKARGEVVSWLQFPENNFELAPKTTKEVLVRMNVPANTNSGEFVAEIIISTKRKWL